MVEGQSHTPPFGMLELDAAGNVRHFSPSREDEAPARRSEIIGHNFFTDLMPVEELKEFRAHFNSFMADGEATRKFTTSFAFGDGFVRVQVMLARVDEQSGQRGERLALVRIVPEQPLSSQSATA